ncbi:FAD-dependent monooxygenase [Nonomuraea africana]|uniref:2-polyprenyl-6-methoxyphenol hydroxylase-like FAD-dependent oxidoreductase n=1 Tax=Nonomuraea africana TaxID=46171 RepID=A0ABR9KXB5_9ACTN|nr:FAD-dependent monooxygenase [Nonomuraea africana]MBE1566187.1 2-polyprenyl-6-methoxyphenol hydroxylase-like FAD-dependent oxidoreductase [Nonomuraea africana]
MRVPVLIVGAGYAGLSAATMLAWRGIPVLLVERHAGTSVQPKAFGVNTRAMELLRPVPGLEEELAGIRQGVGDGIRIAVASSLTDPEPNVLFDTSASPFPTHLSPAADLGVPQAEVERVLRAKAEELGADLRFSTEFVSLEQDDDGVTALIRAEDGTETTVRAEYVIAADGYRSPLREQLGIPTSGKGVLNHLQSIMFDADLSTLVNEDEVTLWYLQNPELTGVFVIGTGVGAHVLGVSYEGEPDPDHEKLVRLGVGVPDLDVTVLDTATFTTAHILADRYREGRVFLAGDAAHTMPPTGGQGGSTALQDGCDLAWRLWLVITGQAGPGFLDSYDAERRPIGELTADAQLANLGFRLPPAQRVDDYPEPLDDPFGALLGYRYHSFAILPELGEDGSLLEDPRTPHGRPGGRAAHVVLDWDGRPISTHDLFGSGFVLLAGPYGEAWVEAGRAVRDQLNVRLAPHRIGGELLDEEGVWLERYGVTKSGAVLIRPDGFIAWRSMSADLDPAATLERVLLRILARTA